MCLRNLGISHIERQLHMSNLYKKIEELCAKRGINITTMCKESGASRASISDLKMGRKQNLSVETLRKIADYFEIGVDSLLRDEASEQHGTDEAFTYAMQQECAELTEADKALLLTMARQLREARKRGE